MGKTCPKCHSVKSEDEFHNNSSKADGKSHICKACQSEYVRSHYRKNKTYYLGKARSFSKKTKLHCQKVKASAKCADCNVQYPNEPWLMEFDHLPEFEKLGDVSRFASEGNSKMIRDEISKCEIVCVVCHRRRTAKRAGWAFEG